MKKYIALSLCIVFGVLLLASCSGQEMIDKIIPKEEAKIAEDYLAKLRDKDYDYIKSKLADEVKPQVTDALLVEVSDYFRDGELLSTEIIGSQVHVFNGVWQGNFSFEYQFSNGWNLANTAFRKVGDDYEVIGFNVYKTEISQKEYHSFTFTNKSLLQYVVLAMAIAVPIFILISIYYCIRTPIPKRKWLWVIFIVLGVSAVQVNWTTGQYAIQLLSLNLFGASAMAAGSHAPWIISASLPLGAILFWMRRKKFVQANNEANRVAEGL